jgi:radical SAM superfamily enzyme YgiQ (UPF0313 family)
MPPFPHCRISNPRYPFPMPDIVLTTLNAKYIHAAFGLRYLMANLGKLQSRACLVEFDINQRPLDIAEVLLARTPRVIGFGVYIWNVTETLEVVSAIRRVSPGTTIVLGGPEVSYEWDTQPIVGLADYVITGEADLKFAEVCGQLLRGEKPAGKIIAAELPDVNRLALPYDLYNDDDVAHRIIYVEASRGCPFTCEFCLSSLDIPVRQFPLERMLAELQRLMARGVKQFKFVDRTFNLNLNVSRALLQFFLERYEPGMFFHFEMVPDRLPESLREVIAKFPAGALQFEVGIQTFNEETGALIKRRQNYARLEDNFRFLRAETGVHIHADLIVGLPGESMESFGAGFDRLVALQPQEIQVGILKRLRGTPISRHDTEWQMKYSANPPYEILQNKLIPFAEMQRLRRFAKYWDLVGNSGNFVETTPLLWSRSRNSGALVSDPARTETRDQRAGSDTGAPFASFLAFSDWLFARVKRTDTIALLRLMQMLFEFLTEVKGVAAAVAAQALWSDYQCGGRRDKPGFLIEHLPPDVSVAVKKGAGPKRQARHLANNF